MQKPAPVPTILRDWQPEAPSRVAAAAERGAEGAWSLGAWRLSAGRVRSRLAGPSAARTSEAGPASMTAASQTKAGMRALRIIDPSHSPAHPLAKP